MLVVLCLISALCVVIYNYLTWNFNYWKKRGIDGPKPLPFLGTYPLSATFRKCIVYEIERLYREYRVSASFIGTFIHQTPYLVVLDPKLLKDVMVTNFKEFYMNEDLTGVSKDLDPLFYRNPFSTQGADWKEQRAAVVPAVTMSKIRQMFPIINETCRKMVDYIANNEEESKNVLDAKELSSRFTADVICNCLFGLDPYAFSQSSDFMEEANRLFEAGPIDFVYLMLLAAFPFVDYVLPRRVFPKKSSDWFIQLCKYAMETRKSNNIQQDDCLDYLIKLQDKKNLKPIEVTAHAYTIFLDGFETSSTILAHVLYQLAINEDCQRKLRNELNKYELNFENLNQIQYLDNVLNEALRVTPTPFTMFKTCTADVTLTNSNGKEVVIERGTKLIVPSYSIHTDPKYYADPLKFDPGHFDEENGSVKLYKDQGLFLPFGNGPRICLGMQLATVQIKAAIFALVKNFDFSTDAPSKFTYKNNHALFFRMKPIDLYFRKVT